MSVRFREDRERWEVRWREGSRNRSRLFRFEQDALDFDNELYRRKRQGHTINFDAGRETLREWMAEAWVVYLAPELQPNTRRNYAWQWDKHVDPLIGDVPLRELDAGRVARWAGDLRRAGVGEPTIRRMMGLLSKVMRYAIVDGKIASNPVSVVAKPRQVAGEWPEPVLPLVVERIRLAMRDDQDRMVVSLLGYAGLRPQELCRADVRHVHGAKLQVYAPKTRRNRTIDLIEPLAEELAAFCAGRRSGPVIRGKGGRMLTESAWRGWRKRVWLARGAPLIQGSDRRPYALRGSFASLLAWEGRPITYVAAQLGHSVQTCSRYYLGVFETVDLSHALPAGEQVRAARAEALEGAQMGAGGTDTQADIVPQAYPKPRRVKAAGRG